MNRVKDYRRTIDLYGITMGIEGLPDGENYIESTKDIFWIKNELFHREDGPAVIKADGRTVWWLNGKPHRFDGPASEPSIFNTSNEPSIFNISKPNWYIMSREVNEKKYRKWLIDNGIDINNLTEEDKQLILLRWS